MMRNRYDLRCQSLGRCEHIANTHQNVPTPRNERFRSTLSNVCWCRGDKLPFGQCHICLLSNSRDEVLGDFGITQAEPA